MSSLLQSTVQQWLAGLSCLHVNRLLSRNLLPLVPSCGFKWRARRILVSYAHMACTERSSVSKKACPPILDRGTSTRRHRASFLCTACLVTS